MHSAGLRWARSGREQSQQAARLLDHLIGASEQRRWNSEPKRLCRFHVDHQLKFCDLLYRQVFGLFAVQTTGDGVLIEFPSVVDAVECAVAVVSVLPPGQR